MRQWPLNRPRYKSLRESPRYRSRKASIAWIFPVRVPARLHLEKNTNFERFARHNGRRVCQQRRFDERLAFEHLRLSDDG